MLQKMHPKCHETCVMGSEIRCQWLRVKLSCHRPHTSLLKAGFGPRKLWKSIDFTPILAWLSATGH